MTEPLLRPESSATERLMALYEHLRGYRFRYTDEYQLQEGLERALEEGGFDFQREFRLAADSRTDFWLGGLVIEVKVAGTYADALSQANRYARKEPVEAVMLATTRRWNLTEEDRLFELAGKPVSICHLERVAF